MKKIFISITVLLVIFGTAVGSVYADKLEHVNCSCPEKWSTNVDSVKLKHLDVDGDDNKDWVFFDTEGIQVRYCK